MLTSSDAEKLELLKFLWFLYEQMQKKIYYSSFSDVNIIRCWKTGIIELCLMLTSSDAVKRDIMEFCLMLISSDAEKRSHWIFSYVNIIRCRKRHHWILSEVHIIIIIIIMCTCWALYPSLRLVSPRFTMR